MNTTYTRQQYISSLFADALFEPVVMSKDDELANRIAQILEGKKGKTVGRRVSVSLTRKLALEALYKILSKLESMQTDGLVYIIDNQVIAHSPDKHQSNNVVDDYLDLRHQAYKLANDIVNLTKMITLNTNSRDDLDSIMKAAFTADMIRVVPEGTQALPLNITKLARDITLNAKIVAGKIELKDPKEPRVRVPKEATYNEHKTILRNLTKTIRLALTIKYLIDNPDNVDIPRIRYASHASVITYNAPDQRHIFISKFTVGATGCVHADKNKRKLLIDEIEAGRLARKLEPPKPKKLPMDRREVADLPATAIKLRYTRIITQLINNDEAITKLASEELNKHVLNVMENHLRPFEDIILFDDKKGEYITKMRRKGTVMIRNITSVIASRPDITAASRLGYLELRSEVRECARHIGAPIHKHYNVEVFDMRTYGLEESKVDWGEHSPNMKILLAEKRLLSFRLFEVINEYRNRGELHPTLKAVLATVYNRPRGTIDKIVEDMRTAFPTVETTTRTTERMIKPILYTLGCNVDGFIGVSVDSKDVVHFNLPNSVKYDAVEQRKFFTEPEAKK